MNAVIIFIVIAVIEHPIVDALVNSLISVASPVGGLGWLIVVAVIIGIILAYVRQFLLALAAGIF